MRVKTICLMLSSLVLTSVSAQAQELPIQGVFSKIGGNGLPENWEQARSDNLKPFGKFEVMDDKIEVPVKSVKLTSESQKTIAQTTNAYPVQTGDCIAVRLYFKGKGTAVVGYAGYDKSMNLATCVEQTFRAYWDSWDCRSKVFEVKDPKIEFIKIFFAAPANTEMSFANITAKKLTKEESVLFSPAANRELWNSRIQGENLASGKKVTFDPPSSYELTVKGDTDETDLTDGKLGSLSDMLWFDPEAVAWYRALNGVTIIVDLGEVRPVKKAVIRINGGRLNGVNFPKELEAWVSKDGKAYYQASKLTKVASTEYYLSDWKTLYYLPESEDDSGVPYVYPFELRIDADARYAAIRAPIYTGLMMITDEVAVIKAAEADRQSQHYNLAYKKQPQPIFHQTAIVRPRLDTFYLADNVDVPNWLRIDDRRPDKKGKFGYIVDVPESIGFAEDKSYPAFSRTLIKTENAPGRKRYHFEPAVPYDVFIKALEGFGPFFFRAGAKIIPDNEKYAEFTTTVDGTPQYSHRSPLAIISIPEVPALKKLTTSLAWMRQDQSANWPNFLKAQRHLGFNTIPLFPFLSKPERYKEFIDDAAKNGFKVRIQMSPTAMLKSWNPDINEYRCVGSKTNKTSACPAYRGEYYQKMLDRITEAAAKFPVDYVTFDEESWEPTQLNECIKCSRCDELRKSKGMAWKDYLEWVQADYLKAFKLAVAKGVETKKGTMPLIGYYALTPDNTYSCGEGKISFLGFKYLYPEWCDEIQPSYYGKDSRVMHNEIRKTFQQIPTPATIVPWLTAGSGAHRETAMLNITEQEILEALMNGAGGLQYFQYNSFESPLDYYYHASALKKIAPYEEFLMKAKLVELTGSNHDLLYTARRDGNDLLLLVGNYGKMTAVETVIELPPGAIDAFTDINQNAKIDVKGNTLTAQIKPDDFALYHVRYKGSWLDALTDLF